MPSPAGEHPWHPLLRLECADPGLSNRHIFCHKDLYGWFHRPDVDAPAEGGPPVPDAMSAGQRQRNLICPSCRVPCGTSPPAQLFALKGVSDALRTVEQHPATGPVTTPTAHPHPHHPAGDEVVQGAEAHRDEKDKTWGGLWDENGKEPDRLAGRFVVRDHADGVRRCGECNWEIQADGICNGWSAILCSLLDGTVADAVFVLQRKDLRPV